MKIFIGADHAGFELKEKLISFVRSLGHEVVDKGAFKLDPMDDYPDYIVPVVEEVAKGSTFGSGERSNLEEVRGIVIGGSGQGEAIVANRFAGVRAAVFYGGNFEIVKLSREHNDSNVLAIGARFASEAEAKRAVELWLATTFSGDARHVRRLHKIDYMSPSEKLTPKS